jgi:hypothetical protein
VPATLNLLITLCMLSGQALTYSDIVSAASSSGNTGPAP